MSNDWDDQAPRDAWEAPPEPQWWETGGASPHVDDAQAGAGVAPGWYWDPDDQTRQRYWDGHAWTEQRRGGQRLVSYGSALAPGWATLGAVVMVLVGAVGLLEVTTGAIALRLLASRAPTDALTDPLLTRLALVSAPISWAAGICWLVWQHKLANCSAVAGGALRRTPGWHVASWFIPVISLWFPFQNMRDLDRGLRATGAQGRPAPLLVWWLAHLARMAVPVLFVVLSWWSALEGGANPAEAMSTSVYRGVYWAMVIVAVPAAALAILVVARFTGLVRSLGQAGGLPA